MDSDLPDLPPLFEDLLLSFRRGLLIFDLLCTVPAESLRIRGFARTKVTSQFQLKVYLPCIAGDEQMKRSATVIMLRWRYFIVLSLLLSVDILVFL